MLWIALHLPALSLESWAATRGPDQAGLPLALRGRALKAWRALVYAEALG